MRWLSFVPGKATLVLLFNAARRRLKTQAPDATELSAARLLSATEELNQIADDVRDAKESHDAEIAEGAPYVSSPPAPLREPVDHSGPGDIGQSRTK